jgi:glyoxylase-like metal-dependent hydrolase (beta-lactamase superfamily II)
MVAVLGDQQQILFSGDHLWWNPKKSVIVASKDYCWWNWTEQLKSVKRLLDLEVNWLLPGHGYAHQFMSGQWKGALEQTLHHAARATSTGQM